MDGPEINSTPDTEPSKPLVLIPVMAEDVERRKRKVVLSWIAAALALALVIWFIYRRSIDPLHAQESYDAGVRLIQATRYEEAILNFDRTIELKPDFADAYRLRGKAYMAETKPDAAIPDFTKIAQMRPADPDPLVERGFAYLDKKDYANAIADADRALARRLSPISRGRWSWSRTSITTSSALLPIKCSTSISWRSQTSIKPWDSRPTSPTPTLRAPSPGQPRATWP